MDEQSAHRSAELTFTQASAGSPFPDLLGSPGLWANGVPSGVAADFNGLLPPPVVIGAESASPQAAASVVSRELYLVTSSDAQTADLADRLERAGATLVRVSPDERLADLAGRLLERYGQGSFDRLQLLSHGVDDSLSIGATSLSSRNVGHYRQPLAQLGSLLSEQGDLLLYGCDLAASPSGERLVRRLAELTGAEVAASSDNTFADALSGRSDWILEDSVGLIAPGYQDLLTGLDWTGELGGSVTFNDGLLSISGASGTFSISGNLNSTNTGTVIISGDIFERIDINGSALTGIEVKGQDYTIGGINLRDSGTDSVIPGSYAIKLATEVGGLNVSTSTGITLYGNVYSFGGHITITNISTSKDRPLFTWNPNLQGSIDLGTANATLNLNTQSDPYLNTGDAGAHTIKQEIRVDPYVEYAGKNPETSAAVDSFVIDRVLNTAVYGLQNLLVPASVKVADLSGGIHFRQATITAGSVEASSDVSLNLSNQAIITNSASILSLSTAGIPFDIAAAVLVGSSDSSISLLDGSTITTTNN